MFYRSFDRSMGLWIINEFLNVLCMMDCIFLATFAMKAKSENYFAVVLFIMLYDQCTNSF